MSICLNPPSLTSSTSHTHNHNQMSLDLSLSMDFLKLVLEEKKRRGALKKDKGVKKVKKSVRFVL